MARHPAAAAVLGVLLVVALSADGSHGQVASQNAEGAQQSTPFSEDRALYLDLAAGGSQLTTVTYVGFANFITTIGSTVVVFMPRTGSGSHVAAPTRTGKSMARSKAPVFVQGGKVTKTKTTTPVERTAAVFMPKATSVSKEAVPESAGTPAVISAESQADSRVSSSGDRSTATTREFNTNDLYPTGLVTSIGGTLVQSDITTVFTTLFYGTFIKGRYAKVARSASSIYHGRDLSTTASPLTAAILSTPVSAAVLRQKTLIRQPPASSASVSNSLARAVGSNSAAQIIVSDETAEVLKQGRALEGSVGLTATPALFSSHADAEEVKSVLKTYYTTYTYFTTLLKDGTSAVRSSLSTVSSVATEQLPAGAVTTQTSKLVSSTATIDGQKVISTEQVTKLLLLSPELPTEATTIPRIITKTFFTTYTYFTTSLVGASSVIKSRLVVSSNVVTSTAEATAPQVTAPPVAVKSELPRVVPQSSNTLLKARSPVASVDAATQAVDVQAHAAAVHQTGLISSRTSSVVNGGVTTVHSTGYFGTVVNGRYLQLIQSTTSVLQPVTSSAVQLESVPVSNRAASQPRPTALPRFAPAPVSTSNAAGPSSRRSNRLFNLPAAIRSSPRSSTAPLPKSRTTILTSASTPISSAFVLRSSSTAKSSRTLQSSTRAFRQFRRSGGERKVAGLLALLAKKRGLKIGAPSSSAPQSSKPSQTVQLRLPSARAAVTTPVSVRPRITSEAIRSSKPSIVVQPTQTRRRVIVKTRRSFRGALGRRQKRPGLRALIKTDNVDRDQTQATAVPSFDFRATEANEINDEQPIDPTEDQEPRRVPDPTTTETPVVAAQSQRVLAFSRGGRRSGGTRSALPLKRRSGSNRPRGLASRFLAAKSFGLEPAEAATTEATTTTTSTTPKPVPTTTEPSTEAPASPFARVGNRYRSRGRRLPFTRRKAVFRRDVSDVSQEKNKNHLRSKRQTFGARNSARRSSLRDILSKEQPAKEETAEVAEEPPRSRRRSSQRPFRRRTAPEDSPPRARTVSPTPSDASEKQQFTLTPNRSRSTSRSPSSSSGRSASSNTRRAIPASRGRRPVRPEAPKPSSSDSSSSSRSSSSVGGSKVSLRQRLQQARFGNSGSSSSSLSSRSKSSGSSSSLRTPSRRQPSVSLPSRTPSRSSSSSRGSSRPSSARRPTNRRPNLFAGRGGNRGSSSTSFEPKIDPTPVLPEGHIIVVSENPITTSIPIVENGRTTYKDVLTATTVTATLEPEQYSVTDIAGELRTHVGLSTAVGAGGLTEVSTLYLEPTEIKTGIRISTRIRGRPTSSVSSYIQPAFTVAPEVSTVPASPLQQLPQGQNNNALMLLLQQLLGGQQPGVPNFGSPPINVPTPKPRPAYRTFSHTTTYVTTLTESALTTVPIFFNGRKTHTVIVNKDVNVITATEVLTSSEQIPGQTVAPAGGLGGGFRNTGFGLTPQQLLLQQLFAQPAQQQQLFQQPLIRPTREPVFAAPSQPPQLEELLRQATEAPAAGPSSYVTTVYISGARPGEFFTQLSTVYADRRQRGRGRRHAAEAQPALPTGAAWSAPLSAARDPPPDDILQFYVMSGMNELEATPVTARATQTLESAWTRPSLSVPHVLDTAPSATYVLVKATEAHRGRVA